MFHCHLIYSLEVWSGSGPSSSQLQPWYVKQKAAVRIILSLKKTMITLNPFLKLLVYFGAWTFRPPTIRPPVHFFFSLGVPTLSTRRGPCRSEAPSTARAAPGDHEPLIGGARWRSMGELCLGRSVTWSFCRWTYRQGTVYFPSLILSLRPVLGSFIHLSTTIF